MRKMLAVMAIVILSSSLYAEMGSMLTEKVSNASPDEMISCIVVLKAKYPFQEMTRSPVKIKIETFRSIARQSQEPLLNWLSAKSGDVSVCRRFWVLNGLHVKARPAVIKEMATHKDVEKVFFDETVRIVELTKAEKAKMARGIAWGVRMVQADKCWDEGYTGEGVVIGIIDTGVDSKHPALQGKWSGHWYVAGSMPQSAEPYDDNKHGTHCMGSILGGDGYGPFETDIGVAPGAKYAAAKGLNSGGSGSSNELIDCLEFMADIKSEVDLKAVSNSWAGSGGQEYYFEVIATLKSLGIVPIFANGNNGSQGTGSVQSPGDYPNVIGVGATDSLDGIADFSSLGPAPDKDPFNDRSYWFRGDWNFIKPNISAPGVQIYSCVPDGEYSNLNGTSMATPHLCGVVALLFQKNQNLTPEMVYNLLLDNTDQPPGAGSYPNNTFGWGRVNALKSIHATPTMDQPWIYVASKEMTDLDPGSTVDLTVTVKNLGGSDAFGTTGKLVSFDNYITVADASFTFGDLKPKDEASNNSKPYKITAHSLTPDGHSAVLGLILHADGIHDTLDYDDTVEIPVVIGDAPGPYIIFEEDFEYSGSVDSFSLCWSTSGNWDRVSNQSNSSSHSASSGIYAQSNSLTLKNGINLSSYGNPTLVFWSRDECGWPQQWKEVGISASTNGGSSWDEIFSISGTDRDPPQWSDHQVPLADCAADNVTFRFEVGGVGMVSDAMFWIDDIRVQIPFDNAPPYFSNTTLWRETYQTGPFEIKSTVTDANGVDKAVLHYRVNNGSWSSLDMSAQGSDVYNASIPAQSGNGTIDYYLEATDKWFVGSANKGAFPIGASQSSGYHSFIYGSTDIIDAQQLVKFTFCNSNTNGLVNILFYLPIEMKVRLSVFNMHGREVASVIDKNVKKGQHNYLWNRKSNKGWVASGLYFMKFEAEALKGSNNTISYKRTERILLVK